MLCGENLPSFGTLALAQSRPPFGRARESRVKETDCNEIELIGKVKWLACIASSEYMTDGGYPKRWSREVLMARRKERTFGQVIRERRRQLDLTQQV